MSVWDVPYHLDDPLIHALERCSREHTPSWLLRKLATFRVQSVPGFDLPFPDGVLADTMELTYQGVSRLYEHVGRRSEKLWHKTVQHYSRSQQDYDLHWGLRAVYDVCGIAYQKVFDEPAEIDFKEIEHFSGKLVQHMYTAGHSSPHVRGSMGKHARDIIRKTPHARYLLQVAAAFDHMLGFASAPGYQEICHNARSANLPAPYTRCSSDERSIDLGAQFGVRIVAGTVFMELPAYAAIGFQERPVLCYLTMKDIKRICETLNGMAQSLLYPRLAALTDHSYGKRKCIERALAHICSRMLEAPDPNNVARFYDVALHTLIASWGCDLDTRPLQKMREKFRDENLRVVGSLDEYLKIFVNASHQEALDGARVYKLLPCPDFNPFTDFAVQAGKQASKNPWFENTAPDITLEGFAQWRKLQSVRTVIGSKDAIGAVVVDSDALVAAIGPDAAVDVADALLAGDAASIPYEAAPSLDPSGLLPMVGLDAIVPETLKDKSLCPSKVDGKSGDPIDASGDVWETNYLLEHMRTPQPMEPDKCLSVVAGTSRRHYHKVFFKPETKKANARNCYSAQSLCRKALSKVELSVAHYLRHRKGNANGKPDYAITNSILESIQGYEGRYLAISFDISGFSPNMSKHATIMSLQKWSELFGDHRVAEAHRVLTNGIAVWNHGFIKQSYALNGTDLEGYFGRLNTDYHIDVMTYALHILQSRMRSTDDPVIRRWARFSAHLQVMIDDGLLILRWQNDVPMVADAPHSVIQYISDVIEEVYLACSMKLSWDKTIISGRCMTFLNEVYLDGRHVGNGLRAYIRIRPERGSVPQDYHDKTNRYVAMSQGAIKSGASVAASVVGMGLQLGMEVARARKLPKKWGSNLADVLMLPTAYGGATVPSITVLGASAGGDPYLVSLGNCLRIADADPHFGGKLLTLVNLDPVDASPLQTLRNPTGVHVEWPALASTALRQTIAKRLPKLTRNTELRALLNLDLQEEAILILASLGEAVTNEAIEKAYAGSRVHLVDRLLDKFKKASSLTGVLTRRQIRAIERANARQLLVVLSRYMRTF